MHYKIDQKNYVYISVFSVISLVLLLSVKLFVGEHFYYDSLMLKQFLSFSISDNLSIITESSYAATAFIYQIIGIKETISETQQAIFSWIMFSFIMLVFFSGKKIYLDNIIYFTFLVMITLFYSVYLGQISKETLVVVILFFIFLKRKINIILAILLMLLYGYFVREYWLMVCGMFIVNYYLILKIKKNKLFKVILSNLIFIFTASILHILIYKDNLTSYRYKVNEYRMDSGSVNTILLNPFNNIDPISDMGNFIFGLTNLIIPLDGLSSLNELFYYVWVFFLICIIVIKVKKMKEFKDFTGPVSLLISFFIVQAVFEPDIGSVLKHQIGLFPLFLYILNIKEVSRNDKYINDN